MAEWLSQEREVKLIVMGQAQPELYEVISKEYYNLTRFNKIATQGAPQMAVDKEANSLSRVYSYYSKFILCLFYM